MDGGRFATRTVRSASLAAATRQLAERGAPRRGIESIIRVSRRASALFLHIGSRSPDEVEVQVLGCGRAPAQCSPVQLAIKRIKNVAMRVLHPLLL